MNICAAQDGVAWNALFFQNPPFLRVLYHLRPKFNNDLLFQVISLEGWTDIMYYVQDAHSFWDWIYFVLLIVVSVNMPYLLLGPDITFDLNSTDRFPSLAEKTYSSCQNTDVRVSTTFQYSRAKFMHSRNQKENQKEITVLTLMHKTQLHFSRVLPRQQISVPQLINVCKYIYR